jgi:hypothetical protein
VVRRRSEERIGLELLGEREELQARLDLAERAIRQGIPEARKPAAAALRRQLRELGARAGEARSSTRLAEIEELAAPRLAEAALLRSELAEERAAEAKRKRDARNEEAERRKDEKEAAKRATEHKRESDKALSAARVVVSRQRSDLRRLTRRKQTRPGERVVAELVRLHVLSGVREDVEVEDPPPLGAAIKAKLARQPTPLPGRRIESRVHLLDHAGHRFEAGQLVAWQLPGVRQALSAALGALNAIEASIDAGRLLGGELEAPLLPLTRPGGGGFPQFR